MNTQHGSSVSPTDIERAKRLEHERRSLDNELRQRIDAMIEDARREGIEIGYRAGITMATACKATEAVIQSDGRGKQ